MFLGACYRYLVCPTIALSVTTLFLLKISKRFREFFFARIFSVIVSPLLKKSFEGLRKAIMQELDSLESNDVQLRKAGSIRVLEVGIGTGGNFQFISREINLIAVDPNVSFESALMKSLAGHPNIHLERLVAALGEDMHEIPDCSVDAVILTHVLCSVTDVKKVIGESKRVLVPGGKLLFMEHVAYSEGSWILLVQKLLDPLWELMACGCHLNRSPAEEIKSAGFSQTQINVVDLPIISVIKRHIYGVATKGAD
ncbi:thiol S-methyltransferase TMT1A-like [Ornithodoros turicata]|uniref:thiol S-methyltransferase TMT1A-like n=1 Tax=Ornithodoros turicata TaxID=34597 RepID=UPI00313A2F5A